MMNRAVFIDKDGTLIPDIPYNIQPERITLSPGAGSVLRRLKNAGYLLIVVSNQSGVARGLFGEAALEPVKARLNDLLSAYDVKLDGFYYCPHLPDADIHEYAVDCACRKPKPGMLVAAANDLNIDLRHSWMIGDIVADSEAGKQAGCRTILIEKDYDPIVDINERNHPDAIVHDWEATAAVILRGARRIA